MRRDIPAGITVSLDKKDNWNRLVSDVKAKKEFKCFPAEQWHEMGLIIIDYRWLYDFSLRMRHQLDLKQQEIRNLEMQLETHKIMAAKSEEGRLFVGGLFDRQNKYMLQLESKAAFSELLHWIGHGLTLAAVVAFATLYGAEATDAI